MPSRQRDKTSVWRSPNWTSKSGQDAAHNLLYGESLDRLQNPSETEYHDLVFMPKSEISEDYWGRKPGYYYYKRPNGNRTVIHAERITQKEDQYEIYPSRVKFRAGNIYIDRLEYCRITRENVSVIMIAPTRWKYSEQTRRYTFLV